MGRLSLVLAFVLAPVACRRGPPERLVPTGAKIIREPPANAEHCYVHRTWLMATTAEATAAWAQANDLPCVDGATPCVHWSTENRSGPPSWASRGGEPNGLDKVDATLARGQLTVDWGDYTCSGPN